MTRKDFELIASVLASEATRDASHLGLGERATRNIVDHVARRFADRLTAEYPSFQAGRFLRACNVES